MLSPLNTSKTIKRIVASSEEGSLEYLFGTDLHSRRDLGAHQGMSKTLRVLHIEDSELDVGLLTRHLSAGGYDLISERVDTADAMKAVLASRKWDVILCDYTMPRFNALAARGVLRESGLDIPFIIISGTVGEDLAIKAMLTGANDYLPKNNIARLIPAIEREMHEAENRRTQRLAENQRRVNFEITRGIITTPNLDEFLKLVHRCISQIVYAENCFVMLHDPVTDKIHFELWADKYDPLPPPGSIGKGFSSYVLLTGEPLLLTEESKQKMYDQGKAEPVGSSAASWLGVPLRTPARTIGVLVLQHYEDENAYSERDLEFVASVGDQIAFAIERKRAEEALSESEERYRDLVENAIDIIYTHDLEGNYTSVNRAAEKITGYTKEEALTMNLTQTVAPDDLEKARQMIRAKIAGHEITAYELEIIAKDGSHVPVEVNTRIIYENGVPAGVQGIARDITERKQLEGQFLQSQKMEAIGLLAGGIAHDFNNLLTAISGYSELTLRRMGDDDPLRHNIKEIKDAGDRAAALTSQLLAFSRKQVLKPLVHNLNSVISNIEKMLRRIIKENVELQTILDPELGNIKADPGQIEQVIMNLAVNARDAMPNGGTLTIGTKNVYLDESYVTQHSEISSGRFIKMTVTDTGEGMTEAIQKRIFDPFFTTKEAEKGTGLGLSTVHGIVKQSGGDIDVFSEIGHGTTFEVYLPCVDESVQIPRWIDESGEDLSGTETILLVEDDEIVRNLVREILTGNGYNVLEAASGNAALLICQRFSGTIHLLLTDMIMPKMSGIHLKAQAIALRPNMKTLLMSGYTEDAILQSGALDSEAALIEKPFTPDSLARKVREVLSVTV